MFVSEDEQGQRVVLQDHEQAVALQRTGQSFRCPNCHGALLIKNGKQLPAHFAHRNNACVASEPESATHMRGKKLLARIGRAAGWQADFEVYLPKIKQRVDVLLTRGEQQVALEFQCSPLSVDRLYERTAGYREIGLPVRWILGPRYLDYQAATKFARLAQGGGLYTEHLDVKRGVLTQRTQLHRHHCQQQQTWPLLTPAKFTGRQTNLVREEEKIVWAIRWRTPAALKIQNECYRRHLNVTGCPWVVHADCTELPGFALPEWAARVKWLLKFQKCRKTITHRANAEFWQAVVNLDALPLVEEPAYWTHLGAAFCHVLVAQGFLAETKSGWTWVRQPRWYDGVDAKIAAFREHGGDWKEI